MKVAIFLLFCVTISAAEIIIEPKIDPHVVTKKCEADCSKSKPQAYCVHYSDGDQYAARNHSDYTLYIAVRRCPPLYWKEIQLVFHLEWRETIPPPAAPLLSLFQVFRIASQIPSVGIGMLRAAFNISLILVGDGEVYYSSLFIQYVECGYFRYFSLFDIGRSVLSSHSLRKSTQTLLENETGSENEDSTTQTGLLMLNEVRN
ncbi:hypothetical protein QE152_g25763 [Popillia japonica]|uniref:Uncharacterized protein n=1 Tax=Popillia japonica TaxID=7064 RepID=A0AAW1JZG7_POPJA